MPACHAGGHEFESRTHRNLKAFLVREFSRLECLPVTQEVTSSNLVRTAETTLNIIKHHTDIRVMLYFVF